MNTAQEFWAKVEKGPSCWEWKGSKQSRGYGDLGWRGQNVLSHRLAYELGHGRIAPGLLVLHSCDRPSCVNPAHLRTGTQAQNGADCMLKNRAPSGERNGNSKLTDDKVRRIHLALKSGMLARDIGPAYGVTPRLINLIAAGRIWRHVKAV